MLLLQQLLQLQSLVKKKVKREEGKRRVAGLPRAGLKGVDASSHQSQMVNSSWAAAPLARSQSRDSRTSYSVSISSKCTLTLIERPNVSTAATTKSHLTVAVEKVTSSHTDTGTQQVTE